MSTSKETNKTFMSQYDKEVEKRLQALESTSHTPCGQTSLPEGFAERFEELWGWYQAVKASV